MSKATMAPEKTPEKDLESPVYNEGDRVWFVSLLRSFHMRPGDRVAGTVMFVFEALGMRIHRIRLDVCWLGEKDPQYLKIVGNVTVREMRPLL